MDDTKADVLARMGFPAQHQAQLRSTNPLELLNKEIERRSEGVGRNLPDNEATVADPVRIP
jgi:putative transposase